MSWCDKWPVSFVNKTSLVGLRWRVDQFLFDIKCVAETQQNKGKCSEKYTKFKTWIIYFLVWSWKYYTSMVWSTLFVLFSITILTIEKCIIKMFAGTCTYIYIYIVIGETDHHKHTHHIVICTPIILQKLCNRENVKPRHAVDFVTWTNI